MTCFMMPRRIECPAKWALTGAIILISVSGLLAADMKRVSTEEAMRAVSFKTVPEYHFMAKQLRLAGPVGVDVVIAEDGKVETVTLVSGNPVLGKMAMEAIKKWKFIPFKSDGKAIKVIGQITITFNYEA